METQNPTPPLLSAAATTTSDELFLIRFHSSLKWCALDHSSSPSRIISYLTFFILTIIIPISLSLVLPTTISILLSQLPESILATISFLTLTSSFQLRQLLLLDGLRHDSPAVRRAFNREIDRAFRHLSAILLPSFSVELAHKTLLFAIPAASPPWKAAALAAALASWVYRTGVFLLVCVLFRMTCELQILRFEEFYKMFESGGGAAAEAEEEAEAVMFREHLRIRRLLKVTSHRYRVFIIGCLVTITVSQLGALMMVLATKGDKNFCNSGDLVVSSVVQLSGFLMCLFGAARITHRAQRVISIASRWHMMMSSSFATKSESVTNLDESDNDDCESKDSFQPLQTRSSFESRQALVEYLQHNGGGITIFGFALDRGLLHTLFAFEMTLVLWILSKVVVLS